MEFLVSYWWIILLIIVVAAVTTRNIKKLLVTVFILLGLAILIIIGFWAYSKYIKLAYSDKLYGFTIKDQRGWYAIPTQKGVYYAVGTPIKNSKLVNSYFGVTPFEHIVDGLDNDLKKVMKDTCYQLQKDNEVIVISFSETTLNNLVGYLCITEGKPTNTDKIFIQKHYTLINEPKSAYDFILVGTYEKDDPQEESKVNTIISNFYGK